MTELIKPHGRQPLQPRLLHGEEKKEALKSAEQLAKIPLNSRELSDLVMLGIGAYSPLTGFMGYDTWQSVCQDMVLLNGVFWPLPIMLSVQQELAASLTPQQKIALVSDVGDIVGTLMIQEKFQVDLKVECSRVYGSCDLAHPGVSTTLGQSPICVSGSVDVFSQGSFPEKFSEIYLTPEQTRAEFQAKGWHDVVAFQTRNPIHRAHEFLIKTALQVADGVLIHSVLGSLKQDDVPAEVATKAIARLIEGYFNKQHIIQSGIPYQMRYAGPKEALLHGIIRQNYGCSQLIVGRDHAGVNGYYGPFEAQMIFDKIAPDAMDIKPLKLDWAFWCRECQGMATQKTCSHDTLSRLQLSGTVLRQALMNGDPIPEHFSREDVLRILRDYYEST